MWRFFLKCKYGLPNGDNDFVASTKGLAKVASANQRVVVVSNLIVTIWIVTTTIRLSPYYVKLSPGPFWFAEAVLTKSFCWGNKVTFSVRYFNRYFYFFLLLPVFQSYLIGSYLPYVLFTPCGEHSPLSHDDVDFALRSNLRNVKPKCKKR